MAQNKTPYVEMRHIDKSFPGVQALDDVSFDLNPGEVHALVGENGAGKSTLMKILSGVYHQDAGEIIVDGQEVGIKNPKAAQEMGISTVYQELNLFPNLTIAENIYSGYMPANGVLKFEDRQQANAKAAQYLERFEIPLDPRTLVRDISIAQQQVVEISNALEQNARILVLDEPTSSLTDHERDVLFNIINQLREEQLGIIYISHRMEEIFEIADRVTVLRDGHSVGTRDVADIEANDVIRMMVGRELVYGHKELSEGQMDLILRVEGLSSEGRFSDVSFELHKGEILGMSGLIGAGRSDVGLALFGAIPVDEGTIKINGVKQKISSPGKAMDLGIAYVSENRQDDELYFNMDVSRNISVSHLKEFTNFGFINQSEEDASAEKFVEMLRIMTPSIEQKVSNLSGGNQQKVILARWLAIKPQILIVDEPTRGIDVGSKAEIYGFLNELAQEDVAIILISSELPEILRMSDRILVMHEGRIYGELSRREATEEIIMALATGHETADA
jgi:ribose transport system ATP-binding protein